MVCCGDECLKLGVNRASLIFLLSEGEKKGKKFCFYDPIFFWARISFIFVNQFFCALVIKFVAKITEQHIEMKYDIEF